MSKLKRPVDGPEEEFIPLTPNKQSINEKKKDEKEGERKRKKKEESGRIKKKRKVASSISEAQVNEGGEGREEGKEEKKKGKKGETTQKDKSMKEEKKAPGGTKVCPSIPFVDLYFLSEVHRFCRKLAV
jgi:hypothetical protein